jgi:hypothetical protein
MVSALVRVDEAIHTAHITHSTFSLLASPIQSVRIEHTLYSRRALPKSSEAMHMIVDFLYS